MATAPINDALSNSIFCNAIMGNEMLSIAAIFDNVLQRVVFHDFIKSLEQSKEERIGNQNKVLAKIQVPNAPFYCCINCETKREKTKLMIEKLKSVTIPPMIRWDNKVRRIYTGFEIDATYSDIQTHHDRSSLQHIVDKYGDIFMNPTLDADKLRSLLENVATDFAEIPQKQRDAHRRLIFYMIAENFVKLVNSTSSDGSYLFDYRKVYDRMLLLFPEDSIFTEDLYDNSKFRDTPYFICLTNGIKNQEVLKFLWKRIQHPQLFLEKCGYLLDSKSIPDFIEFGKMPWNISCTTESKSITESIDSPLGRITDLTQIIARLGRNEPYPESVNFDEVPDEIIAM